FISYYVNFSLYRSKSTRRLFKNTSNNCNGLNALWIAPRWNLGLSCARTI
ncbi:uncharacterized protein SETTUDRAFT_112086, partial [Exserohilum turcica Et28A]